MDEHMVLEIERKRERERDEKIMNIGLKKKDTSHSSIIEMYNIIMSCIDYVVH
jgi:hypothetical protein